MIELNEPAGSKQEIFKIYIFIYIYIFNIMLALHVMFYVASLNF